MTKEELVGGLKNAIERGSSLEKAIQSFISAGYNPNEVRAAAQDVGKGVTTIVQEQREEQGPKAGPPAFPEKKKTRTKAIIIILIIIFLLILIGVVVLTLLFRAGPFANLAI